MILLPLLLLAAPQTLAQEAPPPPLKVYLLAGQSNMVGYTSAEWVMKHAPQLAAPRRDVWCYWQRRSKLLAPGAGHEVGPELPLGHAMGSQSQAPVLLCKFAVGGTTLHRHWRSPRAVARAGGEIGYLYKNMIKQLYRILADPARHCPEYRSQEHPSQGLQIAAFIWFQGENDCFDGMEQHYEQNLRDLIADVRAATASPGLPVVIVQINDSGAWDNAGGGGPAVRAAQALVAEEDPNATWVNTKDLGEGYHYRDGDHVTIGRRIAASMDLLRPLQAATDLSSLASARAALDELFYPGRGPRPPQPEIHLADLKWIRGSAGYGGDPKINRSIEDRPLSIDGQSFEKGIGTHAESELVYAIPEGCTRFVAVAGIDDEMGDRDVCSVVFEVAVDGETVARSVVMKSQESWYFDVRLPAGAKKIELKVLEADSGINSDHADWVDAGFLEEFLRRLTPARCRSSPWFTLAKALRK